MSEPANFQDWIGVVEVIDRYAEMVDGRDWSLAEKIFTQDAVGDYRAGPITGRAEIVAYIRKHLGGCGPTQHLLGNYRIEVEADRATAVTYARMFHMGAGPRADLEPYEGFGEYSDVLVRTPDGWRISRRKLTVRMSRGDRSVLQPG